MLNNFYIFNQSFLTQSICPMVNSHYTFAMIFISQSAFLCPPFWEFLTLNLKSHRIVPLHLLTFLLLTKDVQSKVSFTNAWWFVLYWVFTITLISQPAFLVYPFWKLFHSLPRGRASQVFYSSKHCLLNICQIFTSMFSLCKIPVNIFTLCVIIQYHFIVSI